MAVLYRDPRAPAAPTGYRAAATHHDPARLLSGDANAWSAASAITWGPERFATTFRALWSADALHVRFDARDDSPWHTMTARDDHLWEEEVVEVFVDPGGRGADYLEIEISPGNVACDLRIRQPWPALASELGWDFHGLETRVRPWHSRAQASRAAAPGGDERGALLGWTALASLPWEGFRALSPEAAARVPPRPGDRWSFNVFRIKRPGGAADPERDAVYAAWSVPDGPSFHVPAAFRDLVLEP